MMRDDPRRPVHLIIEGETVRVVPLTDDEIAEQERRGQENIERGKAAFDAHAADLATVAASTDPVIQALVRLLNLTARPTEG